MVTKGGWRDTIIGAVVVLVATILLGLVYDKDNGKAAKAAQGGYELMARFNRADGIAIGSDVRLSGVSVGKVVGQTLDPSFRAVLTFRIAPNIALTADSAAAIKTDGLLGAKYVELQPGADDGILKPGQEITYTQDAMVIEELLDKIIQQGKSKRGYVDKPLPKSGK
ncbi:MAG: outer membrane lipid asymmetry maintenance protein MlaD [Solirubrobacterales bacterium]